MLHPAPAPVVLLLDDHEDSLAMYSLGLLAMGFQPVTASDAEAAMKRALECCPDVIVADMTLPGVSGLEFARQVRNDVRCQGARIIVLTGHLSASILNEARDAGCDRFLVKPCMPDQLAREIRDVLAAPSAGSNPA